MKLSNTKRELNNIQIKSKDEFDKMRKELENENRSLIEKISQTKSDYEDQIEKFLLKQNDEKYAAMDNLIKENEALI